jgi:hypothetical protein
MNISETNKIQGLIPETPGILYGQNERVDELNERILGRFYPDMPLQPNLNVRPVPTKYSHFPIIDRIPFTNESILKIPYYSMETNFTPSTSRGPIDGYFSNVNLESSLRNQYFGLQRGAPQFEYIPSSQSDLYKVDIATPSRVEQQPYPGLFNIQSNIITSESKLDANIGADRFFNNTRIQLRGGQLM